MSYLELSREAASLRKQKKFSEALPKFELLFENHRDNCGMFDWWGYAQTLLKLDIYDKALEISKTGMEMYPDSPYLTTVYTWSLFHVKIKPDPIPDRYSFFEAAEIIVSLSTPGDKFSPLPDTVFRVVELLEEVYDPDYGEILNWIEKLSPENLDHSSFCFTTSEGREVELASDYEKYHAIRIKALQETGAYEDCIELAESVLAEIQKFHHDNEIWISRQMALALRKSGRLADSLETYRKILLRKKDWFLKMELAELYEEMQDTENALLTALDAADDPGKDLMKVGLYLIIARLFRRSGKNREALIHANLVMRMREEEGWSDSMEALDMINALPQTDDMPDNVRDLMKLASEIWVRNLPETPRLKGRITTIMPNGKAGFIKADKGGDHYFSLNDFRGGNVRPATGLEVTFALAESFDRKKQKPSLIAVEVKPI